MANSSKNVAGEVAKAAAAARSEDIKRKPEQAGHAALAVNKDAPGSEAALEVGQLQDAAKVAAEPDLTTTETTTSKLALSAGMAAPSEIAGFEPASKAQETAEPKPSITELKEKIMATNPEFNETMTTNVSTTVAEMQDRSKAAFEKSSELMTEMSDFTKGTVEAMVESGKIFSSAVQDMGKTYAEEAKSAYELMTADMKEMAAIKSPTELFQLQGKIMRRNFDAMVSSTSKNAEKAMKLSNDVFAPLSARMNVAAEKMSKVA